MRINWRLQRARVNSALCHLKSWRYLQYRLHSGNGCTCTFADLERWDWRSPVVHPTRTCPKRTDCGGWTFSPPCGGCDRCIEDQVSYYKAKDKGLIT